MNTLFHSIRLQIFGESHGQGLAFGFDGCPAGIKLSVDDFLPDLAKRKPSSFASTQRREDDIPTIISGVFNGYTTGTPILVCFSNNDTQSEDYANFQDHPRPSHADLVAKIKYNRYNDYRGGGHFSGRLTLPIVAAGVIAKKILPKYYFDTKILSIGGRQYPDDDFLQDIVNRGDSVGGIIECRVNCPEIGIGEPFFDSVESMLAHACFSIPAVCGIEFGEGFKAATMLGSEHNDLIGYNAEYYNTNHAGGINGGIANGQDIVFRVAVKPTPSIKIAQNTYNFKTGNEEPLQIGGRHDACIALRMPIIVEAMTALTLADLHQRLKLLQKSEREQRMQYEDLNYIRAHRR